MSISDFLPPFDPRIIQAENPNWSTSAINARNINAAAINGEFGPTFNEIVVDLIPSSTVFFIPTLGSDYDEMGTVICIAERRNMALAREETTRSAGLAKRVMSVGRAGPSMVGGVDNRTCNTDVGNVRIV